MSINDNEYITKLKSYEILKPNQANISFNFDDIEDCIVLDELGNEIRFGDIYSKTKSIIIFLRVFPNYTI